jgi:hypothetical protein
MIFRVDLNPTDQFIIFEKNFLSMPKVQKAKANIVQVFM